jgi:lipopolysaccharide transport system ATP-binding protein
MSSPIIKVDNLSKRYRIGAAEKGYKTFREAIMEGISAPIKNFAKLRKLTSFKNGEEEDVIWALKDVSFEVNEGEVLGIIGSNGAGKSTLLKILSRITEPTSGSVEMRGRVSSLLEVGTGFHPELTGRENIFLNGAILGMRRKMIERKFDEIVAFAEIEKFIDTPVKRYSSGMYVRLAFAIAAHLEPEILLVDEVLAVGDAVFQKKCLGRMEDVAKGGRTVLFVSHNMAGILRLCQRAILLRDGMVADDGIASEVVTTYIKSGRDQVTEVVWDMKDAPGDDVAKIRAVRVLNKEGDICGEHNFSAPITLEMEFWCLKPSAQLNPNFLIYDAHGSLVLSTVDFADRELGSKRYSPGLYRSQCVIPACLLNTGDYIVSVVIILDKAVHPARRNDVLTFRVNEDGVGRGDYVGEWHGIIRPLLPWTIERLGKDIT